MHKVIFKSVTTGLVSVMTLGGCQVKSEKPVPIAVVGRIVEKGKPIANATVVFHPANGSFLVKPHGRTNDKGEFHLTTYVPNDGAPVGSYRVTVELWQTLRADGGPENRLPAKYAKPESSGLTVEVSAQSAELSPIELRR